MRARVLLWKWALVHKRTFTSSVSKICSVDLYIWFYNSVYKLGHEKCRALLVSRKVGALSATVALSHFTLWCSRINSAEETVVSVGVRHLVKAGRMAVFGGCGCVAFSPEPLAQDPRDSEITDMHYINLFSPLPPPVLP
jgi:hypothetical protein